ncbi:hypothetical protein THIOSC13_900004 [uncultured Thiomicrorhabdus sp.]
MSIKLKMAGAIIAALLLLLISNLATQSLFRRPIKSSIPLFMKMIIN